MTDEHWSNERAVELMALSQVAKIDGKTMPVDVSTLGNNIATELRAAEADGYRRGVEDAANKIAPMREGEYLSVYVEAIRALSSREGGER